MRYFWNRRDADAIPGNLRVVLCVFLTGIPPSVIVRQGFAGRTKVVGAFEHFFITDGHKQASNLMKIPYEISSKNEISIEDIARCEGGDRL